MDDIFYEVLEFKAKPAFIIINNYIIVLQYVSQLQAHTRIIEWY